MTTTIAPRTGVRGWLGLSVLCLATLLLAVDNTVLMLALPHLAAELHPSGTELLWITDVYGFMIAGFIITMGSLGDRIGRRRLMVIGAAAFGAASIVAAFSTTTTMLIAARVLLGLAGAAMGPSALALVAGLFPDAKRRAMAIGVFTACFMGGAATGPVIGGILLESFWWGSVFLMGVPVMVLVVVGGLFLLPETATDAGSGRIDLVSVAMSLAAVLPVVYGLKELADDPAQISAYVALAAGLAFCVAFVRRQGRLAEPLLDVRLFSDRSFTGALLILTVAMLVQGGVYLFVSQHLQLVEGLSPLAAGLWMAVPALGLVAGSLASPVLAGKLRPGLVVGWGLVLSAAGFAVVLVGDGLAALIAGVTVAFLGMAPVGALGLGLIVGAAPAERAGSASALAESSGELGIALGIALLGSLGAAVYGGAVTSPRAGGSLNEALDAAAGLPPGPAAALVTEAQAAFTQGLMAVTAAGGVFALSLAVVSMTLLRHLRPIGEESH
ncbi:MFS transporter [Nonomuraea jabiensis]|uniref:DHA2 family multidrug resistance protein-like MFS transporter n=1 Tax=Nonomuraea jabiensis TaxID=882448 RepID=A0A7W9G0J2_9ACTN|nr:MFS transporter [Nonomuraea jabiensis]MBB5774946.1 DHA2 family multidrug resistance protein-like MFS transporter [Nonomuraea jabiensis]